MNYSINTKTRYAHDMPCTIEGCRRLQVARGWCKLHWQRWSRSGSTENKIRTHHGMSESAEYHIWHTMLARCLRPTATSYRDYGGRGIKVCDRWKKFVNFYADMGSRPSSDFSIDRINVDGDYEPSNCRWATREVQNNNRRKNRLVTINGVTRTLMQWSRTSGISYSTLWQRHVRLRVPPENLLQKGRYARKRSI